VVVWRIVRTRLVAGSLALAGVCVVLQHLACEVAFPTRLLGPTCTDASDTSSDPANCGACGNACDAGVSCYRGLCGGRQVTQVSAGLHACAVVKAGTVFCWGSNLFGETGSDPSTQTCGSSPCIAAPTEVAGLQDVVEVRAGYYSACARKQDGTVWCWGQNQAGQLGHAPSSGGDQTCQSAPCNFVPTKVGLAAPAKAIDVGNLFACALETSGSLQCWGDDTYGELGSLVDGGSASTPVAVPLSGTTSVSAGLDPHACAVFQEGQVACWGENHLGSLGHDAAIDPSCPPSGVPCQSAPVTVAGVAGASAVRAGDGVTCALLDGGAVSCWGDDGLGQFGDGVTDGGGGYRPTPAAGGRLFVALDDRYDFALALDATGKVWAWGSSSRGALGDDAITGLACDNDAAPCLPTPTQVLLPSGIAITQVSAGDEFGLALDSTGAVWAWGANVDGRLGHLPGAPDAGDLTTCGAPVKDETCNPQPGPVPGFP
jgi:alpha-tubulin suppressor-like RCC1 family protein